LPSKKFKKKLYHKICQNAKQRTWRNHRHQRSLNKTLSQNLSKRKAENPEESLPAKKFKHILSQKLFDWYKLDDKGLWHCDTCRSSKLTNA
jgi:hypothetical protein